MKTIFTFLVCTITLICNAQTPQTMTYTYDALNRLSEVIYPDGDKVTYNYDVLGNRTSVVTAGGCTTPVAPTTISVSRCDVGSVTLFSNSACSGSKNWFTSNTGGTSIGAGNSFITPSLNLTTNYYVSCTVGSCESPRAVATATIQQRPSAPVLTANPSTITLGQSSTLTATGCAGGDIPWINNGLGIGFTQTVSPTATTTYSAYCRINSCLSASVGSVVVSFNDCPTTVTQSGAIAPNTYKASQTITSTGNVATPTTYDAGQSIFLNPGFSVGPNEVFIAKIGGCTSVPTNGLVAYYPFDGSANDVSGNGNHGVVTGPSLTTDRFGVNNKAYNFGGFSSSSIIRIPNSTTTQFANTLSISLWYYQNTYAGMDGYGNNVSNGYHMLFAKEADWGGFYAGVSSNVTTDSVYYNHTNKPNYSSVDYNVNAKSKGLTNNLNTWIHMTYTVENGVAKIFRNGVKIGEKILTQNVNLGTANTKDLFFGRYSSTWYPLNGKLDDIRVYNRALSDSEVSTIYNSEKP